jgi:hypothetical protein
MLHNFQPSHKIRALSQCSTSAVCKLTKYASNKWVGDSINMHVEPSIMLHNMSGGRMNISQSHEEENDRDDRCSVQALLKELEAYCIFILHCFRRVVQT